MLSPSSGFYCLMAAEMKRRIPTCTNCRHMKVYTVGSNPWFPVVSCDEDDQSTVRIDRPMPAGYAAYLRSRALHCGHFDSLQEEET